MKQIYKLLLGFVAFMIIVAYPLKVSAASKVATTGGKSYSSLEKAIKKAKDGATVKVLKSIKTTKKLKISIPKKTITIDFDKNAYKYTGKGCAISILKGDIKIKNGNMDVKKFMFHVGENGSLVINSGKYNGCIENDGNLKINGGTFNNKLKAKSNDASVTTIQNSGFVEIKKGKFKSSSAIILINTKNAQIDGGSFSSESKKLMVIENEPDAVMCITNGVFNGYTHQLCNLGTATVKGGTFLTKNKTQDDTINYTISNQIGGELTIDNATVEGAINNSSANPKALTINGGRFNAYTDGSCLVSYFGNVYITNGTFISDGVCTFVVEKDSSMYYSGGYVEARKGGLILVGGRVYLTGGRLINYEDRSIVVEPNGVFSATGNAWYTGKVFYK